MLITTIYQRPLFMIKQMSVHFCCWHRVLRWTARETPDDKDAIHVSAEIDFAFWVVKIFS